MHTSRVHEKEKERMSNVHRGAHKVPWSGSHDTPLRGKTTQSRRQMRHANVRTRSCRSRTLRSTLTGHRARIRKEKVKNKRRKIAQPTEAMNMPAIAGAKRPPLHATLHLAGTAPRTVESKPKGHPRAAGRVMAAGPPKKRTHTRNGRGNVGHPQPPTHALTPWSAKRCVLGAPAAWPC